MLRNFLQIFYRNFLQIFYSFHFTNLWSLTKWERIRRKSKFLTGYKNFAPISLIISFMEGYLYPQLRSRIMKPGSLLQALQSHFFRLFSSFCSNCKLKFEKFLKNWQNLFWFCNHFSFAKRYCIFSKMDWFSLAILNKIWRYILTQLVQLLLYFVYKSFLDAARKSTTFCLPFKNIENYNLEFISWPTYLHEIIMYTIINYTM